MISLNEPKTHPQTTIRPIWCLAFRPFFLGGCFFSVIAIILWWASLQGYLNIEIYGNWLWWHSHEMIFGFACAIIIGFLLTAVQTWTGIPGIKGWPLVGLFSLWASARLAMFLPLPAMSVTIIDAAFLFFAAIAFAQPLLKTRMVRNMVFIIILLALMGLNIASHFAVFNDLNPTPYFHAAIMLIVLMITVMGGRVIPLFTANALKLVPHPSSRVIENSAIISTLILVIFALFDYLSIPAWCLVSVTFIGIIAHSYRLYTWFDRRIIKKPILWSLHLAYSFIPLGLLLMLLKGLGWGLTISLALHSFTVGGISGLILAMISRVALGHTGRPLILPKLMPAALFTLFLGGFIRVLLPWVDLQYFSFAIDATVFCWSLSFAIYLIYYGRYLMNVRADGKPG